MRWKMICGYGWMLGIGSFGVAEAQSVQEVGGQGYISLIEIRRDDHSGDVRRKLFPFVEMIDRELLLRRQNKCKSKDDLKNPQLCPQYEYSVPYLRSAVELTKNGVQLSEDIAGEMVYAWKRFLDRSRWRASSSLNRTVPEGVAALQNAANPLAPATLNTFNTSCVQFPKSASEYVSEAVNKALGTDYLTLGPDPQKINVPTGISHPEFKKPSGLRYDEFKPEIVLERFYSQRTRPPVFCDRLSLNLLPDGVPVIGGEVYEPSMQLCVGLGFLGNRCFDWGPYPRMKSYNRSALVRRMLASCNEALSNYYLRDYLPGMLKLVATKLPWATQWNGIKLDLNKPGRTGTLFQPVDDTAPVALAAVSLAGRIGGLDAAQFPQSLVQSAKNSASGFLQPPGSHKEGSPGTLRLEEYKRWLPAGNLRDQAAYGYTTLFQTWADTVTQPDYARPIPYYYNAYRCFIDFKYLSAVIAGDAEALKDVLCDTRTSEVRSQFILAPNVVMTPAGCQAAPGDTGTLSAALPQFQRQWVSVSEGYKTPALLGHPQY